jgi:hypothetical protein
MTRLKRKADTQPDRMSDFINTGRSEVLKLPEMNGG